LDKNLQAEKIAISRQNTRFRAKSGTYLCGGVQNAHSCFPGKGFTEFGTSNKMGMLVPFFKLALMSL
jgi:hypothetical protein